MNLDIADGFRGDLNINQITYGAYEKYILGIPGREEYNGTTVQCVATDGQATMESEKATLNIQGHNNRHTCGIFMAA